MSGPRRRLRLRRAGLLQVAVESAQAAALLLVRVDFQQVAAESVWAALLLVWVDFEQVLAELVPAPLELLEFQLLVAMLWSPRSFRQWEHFGTAESHRIESRYR